ncbi:thioredoxin [Oecophyllibacter saccharovorans]|uniref:Thioredoxin n=1 Tax=Oecophyllibacter saccharovorans TaxID=2558360 RepID=A0A506UM39_9PROT|nr:thioredoxin [Oecophyllibacter saccharovorans]QDH15410.1 thioredoxin [Oecophyllibacter saccharovorans]TPW34243.1 thioredoxin [Oecophyllibacter saccharovorans]TPW36430.1 thioredoxin [Oecophyllibacter saccharovorans]
MSANVVAANDQNFDAEVLKATGPVLVDFWAEWCGPCKMVAPALEELAREFAGRLKVVKVNIDESPEVPTKYGVRSIPTLMVFRDGQVVGQQVGALPMSQLKAWVEKTCF